MGSKLVEEISATRPKSPPPEWWLLLDLALDANDVTRRTAPGYEYMARRTQASHSTIYRWLRKLRAEGWLRVVQHSISAGCNGGKGKRAVYEIMAREGPLADPAKDVAGDAAAPAEPEIETPAIDQPNSLDEEQLLATVIRLSGDQSRPVTSAAEIIRIVRSQAPVAPAPAAPGFITGFPVVSAERGNQLASMRYAEYLLTPEWRARREVMLKWAGRSCQVCNQVHRLHVHHRTYARRGVEWPSDLIVLCDDCHALFHGKLPAGAIAVSALRTRSSTHPWKVRRQG